MIEYLGKVSCVRYWQESESLIMENWMKTGEKQRKGGMWDET